MSDQKKPSRYWLGCTIGFLIISIYQSFINNPGRADHFAILAMLCLIMHELIIQRRNNG